MSLTDKGKNGRAALRRSDLGMVKAMFLQLGATSMQPVPEAVAVLLVEDEPLIRFVAAEGMEDAGFKVYRACNADQAVRLLLERRDIAAVFTDVEMPGSMSGLELAHYARTHFRQLEIIVTSGRRTLEAALLPEKSIFVDKPYRIDEIVEKLKELLPESRGG